MSASFALDHTDRIVHVRDVSRGLACRCLCVVCREPVLARQGPVREHHFAHASGREPCATNPETLLHRYAKQLIQDAGGLAVPVDPVVCEQLGLAPAPSGSAWLALPRVDVECSVGDLRPDLLGHTADGVAVALEVAYSSFCDLVKTARFAELTLPALELDVRGFAAEDFDVVSLRSAVLHGLTDKTWLWPAPPALQQPQDGAVEAVPEALAGPASASGSPATRLPEEVVTIAGRWVSIKQLRSGDIAVKVISYDAETVSMVRTIAKANQGCYWPKGRSWIVPQWRAPAVRTWLRAQAS